MKNIFKTMKFRKIALFVFVFSLPFLTVAQSQFDKFEDIEGVSSVIVNQKAFELMSKIGSETDPEYLDLIKNINSLKVFATEDAAVAREMQSEVEKYLSNKQLTELMRVKDDGDNVKIYVREGKNENYVKELLMFVKDSDGESVIISLTGDIDLRQISKLTDKMNLPGGDELKNIK